VALTGKPDQEVDETVGQTELGGGAATLASRLALIAGGAVFLVGLGLLILFGFSGPAVPFMVVGLIFLVVYGFLEPETVRDFFSRGELRTGTRAVITMMLVLAAVVLINVVVKDRLGGKQLDLTKGKVNTLASQTEQVVKAIDKPTTATVWYQGTTSAVDAAYKLLQRYHDVNPLFAVRREDLLTRPTLAQQQNVTQAGTVVFTYPGRPPQPTTDSTEQGLTTTLLRLVTNKSPKVYFLTGHGESSIDSSNADGLSGLKQALSQQGITAQSLNLLTGGPGGSLTTGNPLTASPAPGAGATPAPESSPPAPGTSPSPGSSPAPGTIPRNADLVAIVDPRTPLDASEIKALQDYLSRGGHLLISTGPGVLSQVYGHNNVNDLIARYGLKWSGGVVLDPQLQFRSAGEAGVLRVDTYGQSIITQSLGTFPIVLPVMTAIQGQAPTGYTLTPLVMTSSASCARTDVKNSSGDCGSSDKKGPFNLMVSLEQSNAKTGTRPVRLVLIGGSLFATNGWAEAQQLAGSVNIPIVANAINWLAGQDKVISIPARNLPANAVLLSDAQQKLVLYGYPLFLPLLVGVIGIVVYVRRRQQ